LLGVNLNVRGVKSRHTVGPSLPSNTVQAKSYRRDQLQKLLIVSGETQRGSRDFAVAHG
jgi:hypothetical protein